MLIPRLLVQRTLLRSLPTTRVLFSRTLHVKQTLRPLAHTPSVAKFSRRNIVTTSASTTTESTSPSTTTPVQNETETDTQQPPVSLYDQVYVGPLEQTYKRLKLFSITSLALSTTLAPFIFVVESSLPMNARIALAMIAITTSASSTGLVGWCGKSYVTQLKYIRPEENGGAEGMEMTTMSLFVKPRITRVYDPSFLVESGRPFAKWELAQTVVLSKEESEGERRVEPGQEETVAETRDKDGKLLGRWVVTWGENGEGTCREIGSVVRCYSVHEELLP
ncbi:hypothetical protein AGABI1DRAFT_112850 [Agaricus bisporus var. burnettii JB137-S8]|uniref:Uncharacterized protein n=1 Tax=Agaricus bisporus var. burnettii (strain JB137-S8 / ATCC MYA-4627 / FGSC 10392) TaxID=597362 RepID=K5W304_AGABU|nr:uncharacterized protein AGABI1DRAFT_112850 [Agaricus bisporus var. burnettii JB137-S8]EKM81159.1 hypothetical protein AGABI1DRAFT_112850 [Agaricus bisporus var. burnettii JB137-S8]